MSLFPIPKAKRAVSVLAAPLMCPNCHPWVQTEVPLQLRACSEGREHTACWGHFAVQKIPLRHLTDFPCGQAIPLPASPLPQHQLALWAPIGAIPQQSAVKSSCESQLPVHFYHSRRHPRDEILLIFAATLKTRSDQKPHRGDPTPPPQTLLGCSTSEPQVRLLMGKFNKSISVFPAGSSPCGAALVANPPPSHSRQ